MAKKLRSNRNNNPKMGDTVHFTEGDKRHSGYVVGYDDLYCSIFWRNGRPVGPVYVGEEGLLIARIVLTEKILPMYDFQKIRSILANGNRV